MVTIITREVVLSLIFLPTENTNVLWANVKMRCVFWYDIAAKLGFSGLQLLI